MESRGDHAGTGAQRWQDVVSADTMKKVGEARQDPLGHPPRASLDPPPPSTPGKGKVVCDHSLPLIIPSTLPSKGVLKSPR